MKKLFLASIAITTFSISLLLLQVSCKDNVNATPTNTTTTQTAAAPQGKLLFLNDNKELFVSNYSGNGVSKINIVLPAGGTILNYTVSPDYTTIFLSVVFYPAGATPYADLYSCGIDGSNLKKILDHSLGNGNTFSQPFAY